jgi:uncharacterized membrane protein YbaN (DUF454 family)
MATLWFVITGTLLIGFALAGTVLKRLPVTPSMFYLAAWACSTSTRWTTPRCSSG